MPNRGADNGSPGHQYHNIHVHGGSSQFGNTYYGVRDDPLGLLPYAEDAPFNSFSKQNEPTCLPDTRTDVIGQIYSWVQAQDEKCVFWLYGMAGTGKSTIARTVARKNDEEGRLAASFFFSRGSGDISNASKFVTSIARQLAHNIPPSRQHICDAARERSDIAKLSLRDQWKQLVLRPLSKLDNKCCLPFYVLVIDALDECADYKNSIPIIVELLAKVQSLEVVQLRVFLTSRPETPLRNGFRQLSAAEVFVLHDISPPIIDHDISTFLKYNLGLISQQCGLDAGWPGKETIETLVQAACGLFIWAATACRFIEEGSCFADERLYALLDGDAYANTTTTPQGQLDGIYIGILKNSIPSGLVEQEQEKDRFYAILRDVIGSIVALFSLRFRLIL
ncbi:hypothetical protein BDV11DRAFT_86441 [Aspergillus similis]